MISWFNFCISKFCAFCSAIAFCVSLVIGVFGVGWFNLDNSADLRTICSVMLLKSLNIYVVTPDASTASATLS